MSLVIPDAEAMAALGARLAATSSGGAIIYLAGELGTGKTTLVRGWLRGLGFHGHVRSPTYTLVETYSLADHPIHHLDLYRLTDPEELEWIGIRDLVESANLCLIEWPERGTGLLPAPDLEIQLAYHGEGRRVALRVCTDRGRALLDGAGLSQT